MGRTTQHELLASNPDVVVSGTVENQGRFYDRFEHVVLLSAPLHVLVERVSRRTNNPYGQTPEQRAEIARYLDTVAAGGRGRGWLGPDDGPSHPRGYSTVIARSTSTRLARRAGPIAASTPTSAATST